MPDKEPKPNSSKRKPLSSSARMNLARALDKAGRKNGEPQMSEAGRKMQALAERDATGNQDREAVSARWEAISKTLGTK